MRCRKAQKKDIPFMFEILKKNNPTYSETLALKELNEMFSSSLVRPTYVVCEKGEEILGFGGFISSWADNMVFNMFWINVTLEHGGTGVGSRIIRELIQEIRSVKDVSAKMVVVSTNIPAFYEKFGFKKIGNMYDKNYTLMAFNLE